MIPISSENGAKYFILPSIRDPTLSLYWSERDRYFSIKYNLKLLSKVLTPDGITSLPWMV